MHHLLLPTIVNQDHSFSREPETADTGSVWMLIALAVFAAIIASAMVAISR